jgi:hypothetical protein
MSWKFWSTSESIASETPSVMAVAETVAAGSLYWYYAIHFDNYLPLIVSTATAPLVLLRSDESIALGVRLFLVFEQLRANVDEIPVKHSSDSIQHKLTRVADIVLRLSTTAVWFGVPLAAVLAALSLPWGWCLLVMVVAALAAHGALSVSIHNRDDRMISGVFFSMIPPIAVFVWVAVNRHEVPSAILDFAIPLSFCLGLLVVPLGLGVFAIAFFIRTLATARHIRKGIKALPSNYRRLIFCTSPSELPELVPGLSKTESKYNLKEEYRRYLQLIKDGPIEQQIVWPIAAPIILLTLFLPGWLFRFTIKSTFWFWWPIAYLGSDRKKSTQAELFYRKARYGLRAKASYIVAAFSILSFIVTNIVLTPDFMAGNPLLIVYGFLFLANWDLYPWQALSLCLAVLSWVILFWVDELGIEHDYATIHDQSMLPSVLRKFAALELVTRLRFMLLVLYMIVVGPQIILYLNYKQCLMTPAPKVLLWATELYGNRAPPLCNGYRF